MYSDTFFGCMTELTKSPSFRGSFLMGIDPGVLCDLLHVKSTTSQENRKVPLGCCVLCMYPDAFHVHSMGTLAEVAVCNPTWHCGH